MTATKQVPELSNSFSANTVKYCTVRGLTGQPSTVSTDTMTLTVTACGLRTSGHSPLRAGRGPVGLAIKGDQMGDDRCILATRGADARWRCTNESHGGSFLPVWCCVIGDTPVALASGSGCGHRPAHAFRYAMYCSTRIRSRCIIV